MFLLMFYIHFLCCYLNELFETTQLQSLFWHDIRHLQHSWLYERFVVFCCYFTPTKRSNNSLVILITSMNTSMFYKTPEETDRIRRLTGRLNYWRETSLSLNRWLWAKSIWGSTALGVCLRTLLLFGRQFVRVLQ